VGLNTRVGTASFITSVAGRFPSDLRPFCPKLIQALTEAARIESSKAVRKAYATALANVGKCAADKRLGRLVEDTVRAFCRPGRLPPHLFANCQPDPNSSN
jgi:hypothetical protein